MARGCYLSSCMSVSSGSCWQLHLLLPSYLFAPNPALLLDVQLLINQFNWHTLQCSKRLFHNEKLCFIILRVITQDSHSKFLSISPQGYSPVLCILAKGQVKPPAEVLRSWWSLYSHREDQGVFPGVPNTALLLVSVHITVGVIW